MTTITSSKTWQCAHQLKNTCILLSTKTKTTLPFTWNSKERFYFAIFKEKIVLIENNIVSFQKNYTPWHIHENSKCWIQLKCTTTSRARACTILTTFTIPRHDCMHINRKCIPFSTKTWKICKPQLNPLSLNILIFTSEKPKMSSDYHGKGEAWGTPGVPCKPAINYHVSLSKINTRILAWISYD